MGELRAAKKEEDLFVSVQMLVLFWKLSYGLIGLSYFGARH
jgi:hypothetical protein